MAFGLDNLEDIKDYMPKEDEDVGYFSDEECKLILKKMGEMMGFEVGEPKKNCKKCHGRGYVGYDHTTRYPIACNCILKGAKIVNPFDVSSEPSKQRLERNINK